MKNVNNNNTRKLKVLIGYYKNEVLFDVCVYSHQIPWEHISYSRKSFFEKMSRDKKVMLKDDVSYLALISPFKKYNFFKKLIIDITNYKKAIFYCDRCQVKNEYNFISTSAYKDFGTCSTCLKEDLVSCANLDRIFLEYDINFKGIDKDNYSSFLILIKNNWRNFNSIFKNLNNRRLLKEKEIGEIVTKGKVEKKEKILDDFKTIEEETENVDNKSVSPIKNQSSYSNSRSNSGSQSYSSVSKNVSFSVKSSASSSKAAVPKVKQEDDNNLFGINDWFIFLVFVIGIVVVVFRAFKEDVDNKKTQTIKGIVVDKLYENNEYIIIYKNVDGNIFEVENALKYWELQKKDSVLITYFYKNDSDGKRKIVFKNLKKFN
jgi:hypothetical protein